MLVIQDTEDPNANEPVNTRMVKKTCDVFPDDQLHYVRYEGITHVPVLYAGQYFYPDWIKDRFGGVEVPAGCKMETVSPVRRVGSIDRDQNWIVEYGL